MENPSLFNKNNRPESELFSKSKTQNFNNTLLTTENNSQQDYWKILIVDDDEDVHSVTKLGLSDFEYKNKQIHFLHCYSAESARKILSAHSDIAIILLDVVMESITAGLDLVKYIREDIENKQITIILRTGQAGSAPEREVIIRYDINDFKSKTELTIEKLTTSIVAGLRSYEAISSLEKQNKNLEQIVFQRTTEIRLKNIELEKLSIVASETDNSVVIADADGIIEWVN